MYRINLHVWDGGHVWEQLEELEKCFDDSVSAFKGLEAVMQEVKDAGYEIGVSELFFQREIIRCSVYDDDQTVFDIVMTKS